MHDLDLVMKPSRYPRSAAYDPSWVLGLDMGPHPLWQLEELLGDIPVAASAKVLDLGAGRGATSVYLAREYGCSVVSLDLWVPSDERRVVLVEANVSDQVSTIDGDIRTLDLGDVVFDAVVSVDAFEYFGTDVHFLPRLLRHVKPGGLVAMSTPGLRDDPYEVAPPSYVTDVVGSEAAAWHSPGWWQKHWELTGALEQVEARWQVHGRDDWLTWERARLARQTDPGPSDRSVLDMLDADRGEQLGFVLATARKRR